MPRQSHPDSPEPLARMAAERLDMLGYIQIAMVHTGDGTRLCATARHKSLCAREARAAETFRSGEQAQAGVNRARSWIPSACSIAVTRATNLSNPSSPNLRRSSRPKSSAMASNSCAETMLRTFGKRLRIEGSGCYGHNGADDAAADAALIARAYPGVPVRVQWMREQEHGWEPYGPAMVTHLAASLGEDGAIRDWHHEVWSNTHSMRPGGAGSLLAAQHITDAFAAPAPKPLPLPEGGGDRNAIPLYNFPNARVVHHFLPTMPLRVSALRALGAYMNVFSIESFMDELAKAAGQDPVEFRLRHLEDSRARDVVTAAAEKFGWSSYQRNTGRGRGFAFARYKNLAAYCAIAAEVEVDRDSGQARLARAVAAVDSGQIVNPDGLVNQVEGAILQSASWTLYESVSFDDTRITSIDWSTYPIMRFAQVPDSVEVHLIDLPGLPFLGAGETGQGPAAGAVANAVADAIGKRIRDLPLSRERIKQASI